MYDDLGWDVGGTLRDLRGETVHKNRLSCWNCNSTTTISRAIFQMCSEMTLPAKLREKDDNGFREHFWLAAAYVEVRKRLTVSYWSVCFAATDVSNV